MVSAVGAISSGVTSSPLTGEFRIAAFNADNQGIQSTKTDPPELNWNFNPTSPSSWNKAMNGMISQVQKWYIKLEQSVAEGILGDPNHDPNETRQKMYQATSLMKMFYDLLEYTNSWTKANREAEKATFDLAFSK